MNSGPSAPPARQGPHAAPSFTRALFLGELHEDLVFPFQRFGHRERRKIQQLTGRARSWLDEHYDERRVEEQRWVGDETIAALGEMGLLGLYVPPTYGGQGLSQSGYARVFEELGQVDASLATVLGVHQSIGYKPIVLFGNEEQKARFLPDLVAGRKLAAFALTEPGAGSDAYHLDSRAVREADGAWRLNGEKRYIGNGSREVITTFARTDGGDHVALIVEKGMDGFEVGERFDTMGLRGNDLRRLRFHNVRVPPDNLLGEPGDGFDIAMTVLNNGRMSLASGCVGATKRLLDLGIARVRDRNQFGRPIADFELVEEKIAWMVSYLFGLESMVYATTKLVDDGVPDFSLESAMIKVVATEFLWYAANRVFQLAGGDAYVTDYPYEKILRDIRVFPVFEGANDVLRAYVALSGLQGLGETLPDLHQLDLRAPVRSLGTLRELAGYLVHRLEREIHPDRLTRAHPDLRGLADPVAGQVTDLRDAAEGLLRRYGRQVRHRQWHQKRIAHAAIDIFAQTAVLARTTRIFEDRGADVSGQERYIAETFCTRAADRVGRSLNRIRDNDDDRMHAIARIAYERGRYGYNLLEA